MDWGPRVARCSSLERSHRPLGRKRDNQGMTDRGADPHPYLAGLVLTGRKVVVVGGGHVAQRRVSGLLAAGADVTVVSLEVTPAIEGLAGELTLVLREFTEADLDGAWYVVATTDDPVVNARVVAAA